MCFKSRRPLSPGSSSIPPWKSPSEARHKAAEEGLQVLQIASSQAAVPWPKQQTHFLILSINANCKMYVCEKHAPGFHQKQTRIHVPPLMYRRFPFEPWAEVSASLHRHTLTTASAPVCAMVKAGSTFFSNQ